MQAEAITVQLGVWGLTSVVQVNVLHSAQPDRRRNHKFVFLRPLAGRRKTNGMILTADPSVLL